MVESSLQTGNAPKLLDRSLFDRKVPVTAVTLPVTLISQFQKQFRDQMLQMPKIPACKVIEGKTTHKLMLMRSDLHGNAAFKEYLTGKDIESNLSEMSISYENYNYQDALKHILPEGIEIPGGFEAIGDVAHLNLHVNQMPFKLQIG